MLMKYVELDASHMLGDFDWCYNYIAVLPESIGDLTVDGDLWLNSNQLESLPESVGKPYCRWLPDLQEHPSVGFPPREQLPSARTASLCENSFPGLSINFKIWASLLAF